MNLKMNIDKSSLKFQIAFIVGLMVSVIVVVLMLLSGYMEFITTRNVYRDSMIQLVDGMDGQLTDYYEERLCDAMVLEGQRVVREVLHGVNADLSNQRLKNYYDIYGVYENLFVSTAENDSRIVSAAVPQSIGLRWRNAGDGAYAENISKALAGESCYSPPSMSPVTGDPLVLLTIPIKENGKVYRYTWPSPSHRKTCRENCTAKSRKNRIWFYHYRIDFTFCCTSKYGNSYLKI